MNIPMIQHLLNWMTNLDSQDNWSSLRISPSDITNVKNTLIHISQDIAREYPFFSDELFTLKDRLFIGYGFTNPAIWGRIFEILIALLKADTQPATHVWGLIHPRIEKVSKRLYLDGHYSDAACDAFIEINDRVKKLFSIVHPQEKTPDGDTAMKTVFSAKSPIIEICDHSNDTGFNIQKGYMEMLSGAMSALRNPKAHANITISADESMRQIVFASMLMYKIDEAVRYSNIQE